MAFAFRQSKQGSSAATTSITITPTSSQAKNNLVIVNIKFATLTPSGVSVTDNASIPNTYASVGVTASGGGATAVYQFYGVQVTAGATTVTASWTGNATVRITVDEYSGGALTNATVFDQATTASATSTSVAVGAFSPASTGELICASAALTLTTAVAAGTGYTLSQNNTSQAVEYKLSSGASETAPMTLTGATASWAEVVGAYKVAPPTNNAGQFFVFM